ncbi:hypothetical protein D3C78_1193850 [compost metagenome]
MAEHLYSHQISAHVRRKSQLLVCLNGVGPQILQFICTQLIDQTNSSPLLAQVKNNTSPLFGNQSQGCIQL